MATGFLNSLSSIIYVGQIFGVMPVQRRRRRRQPIGSSRRQWQGRPGGLQQSSFAAGEDGMVCMPRNLPHPPVTMAVLNLHDKRVFGEDDANGIVNITADMSVKDYGDSDKSVNANEGERAARRSSTSNTPYYVTKFNWKYPNTVYSLMLIAMGVCEWTCTVYAMVESGISLGAIGAFNFYGIANFEFIAFFHLARKWPQLYTFWEDAARVFDELPYQTTTTTEISPGASIQGVFWVWTLLALCKYKHTRTNITEHSLLALGVFALLLVFNGLAWPSKRLQRWHGNPSVCLAEELLKRVGFSYILSWEAANPPPAEGVDSHLYLSQWTRSSTAPFPSSTCCRDGECAIWMDQSWNRFTATGDRTSTTSSISKFGKYRSLR